MAEGQENKSLLKRRDISYVAFAIFYFFVALPGFKSIKT